MGISKFFKRNEDTEGNILAIIQSVRDFGRACRFGQSGTLREHSELGFCLQTARKNRVCPKEEADKVLGAMGISDLDRHSIRKD